MLLDVALYLLRAEYLKVVFNKVPIILGYHGNLNLLGAPLSIFSHK